MAISDDPEWLLKYIRHSFITSDDTGMCEMVIQDNDLMTLDEHRRMLKEKRDAKLAQKTTRGLPESFGRSTPTGSPQSSSGPITLSTPVGSWGSVEDSPLAPSPDMSSGWDFGVRRRSNTAQKLERIRKERQSRIKVHSIPWKKRNQKLTEEQVSTMFLKKDPEGDKEKSSANSKVEETTENRTSKSISSTTSIDINSKSPEKHVIHYGFDTEEENGDHALMDVAENKKTDDLNMNSLCNGGHGLGADQSRTSGMKVTSERKKEVSALSKMLLQSSEQYNNPFREYSKFNAQGHEGTALIKRVNIYVWPFGADKPRFANMVTVLANIAKVQDVVGLTCWQYTVEDQEPKLHSDIVQRFSLYIAEDDGTIDQDIPPLEPQEPFSKFGFTTLALVEKQPMQNGENGEDESGRKQSVFVKVNDHGGFSLILVDDLSVTMGDILRKTLKRRKGQNYTGKYRLEYQDRVGEAVNEDQTLESTGVMEFHLVREHSTRSKTTSNAFEGNPQRLSDKLLGEQNNEYTFPPTKSSANSIGDKSFVFFPTMEYQTFKLYQLHKLRSSTPVLFGVGPNQVDVEPVNRRETRSTLSLLFSPRDKTLSIRASMIAYCAIHDPKNSTVASSLSTSPSSSSGGNSFSSTGVSVSLANFEGQHASRTSEKLVFKLYYRQSENHTDFKHLNLEGLAEEVHDAVARVEKIIMWGGNGKLREEFEAVKFGLPQSSTTSSSNNNTVPRNRRGSLFR